MNLADVMKKKKFAVVGDTKNPEKYACIIKNRMLDSGYSVHCVGKELASLNDIDEKIEVVDLCIHPSKGIELLKESNKNFECVVIQPGAESEEIFDYLTKENIPYLQGCLLVGLSQYPNC